jgi:hypothetical protein
MNGEVRVFRSKFLDRHSLIIIQKEYRTRSKE